MASTRKPALTQLSRRFLLKNAVLIGGATVATTMLTGIHKAEAKVRKSLVQYRDRPNGSHRCDNCAHFIPPDHCKVVSGKISPHGWCSLWRQKSST